MLWAASMANIRYDSSGSPVINSASDYLAYQAAKDKIMASQPQVISNEYGSYLEDQRYIALETRVATFNIEQYKKDFVLEVFPILLEYEKKTDIPAEIMFGQICLESAYGQNTLIDKYTGVNANNYFGYKGTGPAGSVICDTFEYIGGEKIYIEDKFRAYNNLYESLNDYTDLLLRNYKQYTTDGTPEDWANALVEGGYATAPSYGESVLNVAQTWRVY
jgi:flagellum-specific peptidoglycan hydrolase FlgJ